MASRTVPLNSREQSAVISRRLQENRPSVSTVIAFPYSERSESDRVEAAADARSAIAPASGPGTAPPSLPPGAPPPPREELFTLEQAFDPGYRPDGVDEFEANQERAFRAVSFLLDYLSDDGNSAVDGFAAVGLARCLYGCANNMARIRNRRARIKREEATDGGQD